LLCCGLTKALRRRALKALPLRSKLSLEWLMISRKQFFEALLYRGFRAVSDLTGGDESRFSEHDEPSHRFDLPSTELSPSLLAIEAERRGIHLQAGCANELRQVIYQELAQNGPGLKTCKP
jgi:hypothetical protein